MTRVFQERSSLSWRDLIRRGGFCCFVERDFRPLYGLLPMEGLRRILSEGYFEADWKAGSQGARYGSKLCEKLRSRADAADRGADRSSTSDRE